MTSNFLANALLDFVFGGDVFAPPDNLEICLMTVMPTASGGGTEVSGGSYAPQVLVNDLTNFPEAINKKKENGVEITFPAPTADWGDILGIAVKDADSGDFLLSGAFTSPITVLSGDDPLIFPAGSLTFSAIN